MNRCSFLSENRYIGCNMTEFLNGVVFLFLFFFVTAMRKTAPIEFRIGNFEGQCSLYYVS